MMPLIRRLFFENWLRKLVALLLAIVIWAIVNYSMTVTKLVSNIPVRVINLPREKTIEGMQVNGKLLNRITLTITGNKTVLDDLSSKDLEIILDATGKPNEWIASVSKKQLVSLNPDIDINKSISKVVPQSDLIIRQTKLVTEKIPVLITHPIGEAPKGYQFLDVWPYQIHLGVTGPEATVKQLKTRGLKLTFNLSDISKAELDALQSTQKGHSDEISFFVPNSWKKIIVSSLSEMPFEIDDPQANALRIDFSRQDLLPLASPLPVALFFPPKYCATLNPETYSLASNDFILKKNGVKIITAPLFAQGVSRSFLETVKDMIQLVVIAAPKSERETLLWNIQFVYPHELEDRYVAKVMSEGSDEASDIQPHLREDYLRNRFRSYMNRFRLYTPNHKKLALKIEFQTNTISVTPLNYP